MLRKIVIRMEEVKKMSCMKKAMPFILVVLLQVGLAGMDILTKAVLNEGMSNYVLVVYRHGVAAIVMAPFAFYFDKYFLYPFLSQNTVQCLV